MADVKRVSREHERAAFVYEKINAIKEKENAETRKKFRSLMRSLPLMIRTNGLGTSVAFLYSKTKGRREQKRDESCKQTEHTIAYDLLQEWLRSRDMIKEESLITIIINQDSNTYRMLLQETMALLVWAKLFAEGMLDEGK